jgi:hypothetical protein
MACRKSSPRKQSTHEPPKKRGKSHHCDGSPKPTKETLLDALKGVENEIKKLGNELLEKKLEKLRGQVRGLLENQEKEINNLRGEIQTLKKEVDRQKAKNEKLEKVLVVAQATWLWEKHLARFVVDSSRKIYQSGWMYQMEDYLKEMNTNQNRFTKIQNKLKTTWTKEHWQVVFTVRNERNGIAHPDLIDLDLVESQLEKMYPKHKKVLGEMLDELKMTASLMKFGRLADFYEKNKKLFPTQRKRGKRVDADALKNIISWNCKFEQIDGLQSIEHEEAKKYLTMYVDNPREIDHYLFIVDFIKDGNSKRLGKLAWEFEGLVPTEYGEALRELKKLLPNPDDESEDTNLDKTIAKLHIPDFLPKNLWKDGIEIVEKYFE